MSKEKVVIIIPTYNEASVIEETVSSVFHGTAQILNKDIHVLVFDSHSTDGTAAIIERLQEQYPQLHLKNEAKKSGLGSAYMQAMRYALDVLHADIIMEFDADLSHRPEYIAPMLEKMMTHDVVVGSRYVFGGSIPKEWGFHRKLLSVLGNLVARLFLTPKYKDFTSGFRATNRELLQKSLPSQFISNQYAYKIQLLWLLHQQKARIFEHPIHFIDRQKGKSKLPANSILDSLRVLFILRFNELKRYIKMCLVGLSGLSIQFLLYNVFRHIMSPIIALQLAVSVAIINNYTLNHRFTFKVRNKGAQHFKSFGLFIGYSAIMVGIQSYLLHLGIKYLGSGFVKENLVLCSGVVLGSILNYFTYSRYIWRENTEG